MHSIASEVLGCLFGVSLRSWEGEGVEGEGRAGGEGEEIVHQNCTLCMFATIRRMLTPGDTPFGSPVLHTRVGGLF